MFCFRTRGSLVLFPGKLRSTWRSTMKGRFVESLVSLIHHQMPPSIQVNRARYMPQNPSVIATKTPTSEVKAPPIPLSCSFQINTHPLMQQCCHIFHPFNFFIFNYVPFPMSLALQATPTHGGCCLKGDPLTLITLPHPLNPGACVWHKQAERSSAGPQWQVQAWVPLERPQEGGVRLSDTLWMNVRMNNQKGEGGSCKGAKHIQMKCLFSIF